ncbi:MAG: hypothetical protein JWN48_5735 [Myxococcaceae bacterium]|nr:hypothetical protein [Myxococcaceae bacterium]
MHAGVASGHVARRRSHRPPHTRQRRLRCWARCMACLSVPGSSLERPAILRASALRARSDQLDFLLPEIFLELRAVVGAVADEPLRLGFGELSLEGALDESDFVTMTCSDGGRYRKTIAVCDGHDLGGEPTTSSSCDQAPFCAGVGAVDDSRDLRRAEPAMHRLH